MVDRMKKTVKNIAERYEMPSDALFGDFRLTLCGENSLMVENHHGILEYSDCRIILSAGKRRLCIMGTELVINAMNGRELSLNGKISSVEICE